MKIDAYNLRARMMPVVLLVLPLIVAAAAIGLVTPTVRAAGAASAVLLAVMLVAAVVVRRRGQALQDRLWDDAGGPPTTLLLRHDGPTPPDVLERRHRVLAEVTGTPGPSPEEQRRNPAFADGIYGEWADWLIQQTRKDPVVLEEVTTYGFMRNSVGIRRWGIVIDVLVIVGSVTLLVFDGSLLAILPLIAATAMIVVWLLVLTEAAVRQQAETYARSLYRALPGLRTLATAQ